MQIHAKKEKIQLIKREKLAIEKDINGKNDGISRQGH